jgi:hypothetical protein
MEAVDELRRFLGEGLEVGRVGGDRRVPDEHEHRYLDASDFVLVPNAAKAAEMLPQGELTVLPDTTHIGLTRSQLVVPIVKAFFRG